MVANIEKSFSPQVEASTGPPVVQGEVVLVGELVLGEP